MLEDRSLVRALDAHAAPRSRRFVAATVGRFVGRSVVLMLRRRWYRFGYACVNFGAPISMRAYGAGRGVDFRALDDDARFAAVERLGGELLRAIAAAIPVLPGIRAGRPSSFATRKAA